MLALDAHLGTQSIPGLSRRDGTFPEARCRLWVPRRAAEGLQTGTGALQGLGFPLGKRELKIQVGENVFIKSQQPVTLSQQGNIGLKLKEV